MNNSPWLALPSFVVLALSCGDEGAPELPDAGPASAVTITAESVPPLRRIVPALERTLAEYDAAPRPEVNVLLISLDSVRRDYLSCYGYDPPHASGERTTPHIDRIGAEGVVMEDFYSNTSWTLPSHMSLMCGQPDLIHSTDADLYALAWSRPTIAWVLHRLGYATAGFYTGPYCHERFGFGRGFEVYESAYGPAVELENSKRQRMQERVDAEVRAGNLEQGERLFGEMMQINLVIDRLSHRDRSSHIVTDKAMRAIEKAESEQRPWFVFAHYFDPHYDYDPPEEYRERFDPDYQGGIDGRGFFSSLKVRKPRANPPTLVESLRPGAPPATTERRIGERDLDHIKALYAAEIAWTDAQIGRLLDMLRERGILDDTLVIVTADHGEEFFEHGGVGHRHNMLEEQLQIPMVMRLPKVLPAGARVRGLAALCDVFPTVLEVLGLPIPSELQSNSVLPLIDGRSDGSDRYVLGRLIQEQRPESGPPVVRITVRDVFYKESIKIFRYRHYREPVPLQCPPERAERVRKNALQSRNNDLVLQWIDLSAHPREQSGQFRDSFESPRAAAALAEFQRVFESLAAQPRESWMSLGGETSWLTRDMTVYRDNTAARRAQFEISAPGR